MKSEKNFTTTLLLALFLGGFGAHRFYVGRTASAIVMLLMSITLVLFPIVGVWAFIDFIVILTGSFKDKDGLHIKS